MWPIKKEQAQKFSTKTYEVGMLVELKSGSVVMTVSEVYSNGLDCCWYDALKGQFKVLSVRDPNCLNMVKGYYGPPQNTSI